MTTNSTKLDDYSSKSTSYIDTGRTVGIDKEKVYVGENGVEFTMNGLKAIKDRLANSVDTLTEREMGILISAGEDDVIKKNYDRFKNVSRESVDYLSNLLAVDQIKEIARYSIKAATMEQVEA